MAVPHNAAVLKTPYAIDLSAGRVTRLSSRRTTTYTQTKDRRRRRVQTFASERVRPGTPPSGSCESCPLFARCVHSQRQGRSVRLHCRGEFRQAARRQQQPEEFKIKDLRLAAVGRKMAEWSKHRSKQARYLDLVKSILQA